jgi:hypothetical protein
MASWNILQARFTQGELSPLLYGQSNIDVVNDGCQLIRNGLVTVQGPVITRPGTVFLTTYAGLLRPFYRLWSFIGPQNQDLIAGFYDGKVAVLDWQNGVIGGVSGAYVQIITNPNFTLGLNSWVAIERETISPLFGAFIAALDGQCLLRTTPANVPPQAIGFVWPIQEIFRVDVLTVDGNDFVLQCTVFFTVDGPGGGPNPINETSKDYEYFVRLRLGTTYVGNEIGTQEFRLNYFSNDQFNLNISLPTIPAGTEVFSHVEFYARAIVNNAIVAPDNYDCRVDNVFLFVRPTAAPAPVILNTIYQGNELEALHFVQSPFDNRELLCLHPDHPPHALFYDSGLNNWGFAPYTFTNQPSEWGPDQWPSIGAGAQGRLILSGLSTHPETIWGSQTYDWHNFDLGAGANNEGIEVTGIERDVNTWVMSGKTLLYGDRRREYSMNSTEITVTPTNINISTQSAFGTERNPQKILMGKNVVLSAGGNNDLRLLQYSRENGGFISPNIILKAEHLGKKQFRRHFYTRDPNQILWNVMQDGTITLCSFDDELNIQAWSRLETTGIIIDGCVVNDEVGRNVVVLAIQRDINGTSAINIETISYLRVSSTWETTDCTMQVFSNNSDTIITGLDIFNNKLVSVFLDGNYDGNHLVTNNQLEISVPAFTVKVGYPYQFTVTTFPQDSLSPSRGALGITAKKRFSKLGIRGVFSLPPMINGQRPPDRSPQGIMNIPEVPQQFIDADVVDLGTNETGVITIEETLPVQLTIAAIYGQLTGNQV